MSVLKLGVIGTGWITEKFVNDSTNHYKLTSIYSRKIESAEKFAEKFSFGIETTTELDKMLDLVDIVYIANPNAMHFKYIQAAIQRDVNVIVEKPAVINPTEFNLVKQLLQEHPNVYFFEAARHIHTNNFLSIKKGLIELGEVSGANLNFQQFSSRYNDYKKDLNPNVFSLEFGGGVLYDLGVYVVYAAICWFGMPKEAHYTATLLTTGADGRGQINFIYDDFIVSATISKINTSYSLTEIYHENKTISIDHLANINNVELIDGDNVTTLSKKLDDPTNMTDEANVFYEIIENNDRNKFEELLRLSEQVNQVMFDLRNDADIKFASDEDPIV